MADVEALGRNLLLPQPAPPQNATAEAASEAPGGAMVGAVLTEPPVGPSQPSGSSGDPPPEAPKPSARAALMAKLKGGGAK